MEAYPIAFVIGRNYTTRLTLTRSAGMVGCSVVLIQTDKKKSHVQKIDKCSKYVVECHLCPEPQEGRLIDILLGYKDDGRQKIILPADDYAAAVIDKHLDKLFSCGFLMPHVAHKQGEVLKIMDKEHQKSIAKSVGLHVADGWVSYYREGKYQIPELVTFPCFTKPVESYDGALKGYLKRCDNERELQLVLNEISKKYQLPILIEQYVDIEREYGVQGVSLDGRVIIPSVVFKDGSRRGLTISGRIVPISSLPNLQKKLTDFIQRTGFTGIFDVDLFGCNGKYFFNELNVRLGANGFALTYGVANVPGMFIKYMFGDPNVTYDGLIDFEPLSFASEKVVRDMFYDGIITLSEYKSMISNVDILSLKYKDDDGPYRQFSKLDKILPLWRWQRVARMKMKKIMVK